MFLAFWQVQTLSREIFNLQRQIMNKTSELSKHQRYASMLGGTSRITAVNIAGLPSYLIPRASLFANYAEQASTMSASQNLQMMKMCGQIPYTGNPATQMQIEMSAFARFKEQAMKSLKEREAAIMSEKEKEIQLELNQLKTQLDIKQESLNSAKELLREQTKESALKFGL